MFSVNNRDKFSAIWLVCGLVVGCLLYVQAADVSVNDEDVLVLTNSNFDDVVRSNELMLVEFYAPWCGHCKKLIPEYAAAATTLKNHDPPIPLAKVDATIESSLASKYKVSGYPKLFVFRNGRESDYSGPRDTKGIVDYMKKQVGPAAKPIQNVAELTSFTTLTDDRDNVVVGFFSPATLKSSQLYASYLLVATKLRDEFAFGIVTDLALLESQGVTDDILIAYKAYDDKKTEYRGSPKRQNVEDWLATNSLPLVGEFTQARAARYQKRGLPIAKFFMRIDWSPVNTKHTAYYVNRLQDVATQFQNQVVVTIANSTAFASTLEELGWRGKENVLIIEQGKRRFRFEQEFKVPLLKQFFADYLAGSVSPFVKSEVPPATNDAPVKVVVGSTFDQIVQNDKDVLIEFYAPWCGHCKTLEPKYTQLAKKYEHVETLVIAKMDSTANDSPLEYEVSSYPTIYFKPAGNKSKPIRFEGEREVADLGDFIKKNAKHPVKRKRS